MTVAERIKFIRDRMLDEKVVESQARCIEKGIPPEHFNPDSARRSWDNPSLTCAAIIEYLGGEEEE